MCDTMKNKPQNISEKETRQLTIFDAFPDLLEDFDESDIPDSAHARNIIDEFDGTFDTDSDNYKNALTAFSAEIDEYENWQALPCNPAAIDWMAELKISLK